MPAPKPNLAPSPFLAPGPFQAASALGPGVVVLGKPRAVVPVPEPEAPTAPRPEALEDFSVEGRMADRMAPYGDGLLTAFAQALASPLQPLEDLTHESPEGRPGFSLPLDVDGAPLEYLPWLAQVAGVRWSGPPSEALRERIRTRPAANRCTPASIVAAAQTTLTGAKSVRLLERDEGPWHFSVVTRAGETPDPAATARAIESQLPAGFRFAHVVSDAPLVNEGTRTIDAATGTIDAATLPDIT